MRPWSFVGNINSRNDIDYNNNNIITYSECSWVSSASMLSLHFTPEVMFQLIRDLKFNFGVGRALYGRLTSISMFMRFWCPFILVKMGG